MTAGRSLIDVPPMAIRTPWPGSPRPSRRSAASRRSPAIVGDQHGNPRVSGQPLHFAPAGRIQVGQSTEPVGSDHLGIVARLDQRVIGIATRMTARPRGKLPGAVADTEFHGVPCDDDGCIEAPGVVLEPCRGRRRGVQTPMLVAFSCAQFRIAVRSLVPGLVLSRERSLDNVPLAGVRTVVGVALRGLNVFT